LYLQTGKEENGMFGVYFEYRGWIVENDPYPIGLEGFRFCGRHPDYDSSISSFDDRIVFGESVSDVRQAIDEWEVLNQEVKECITKDFK